MLLKPSPRFCLAGCILGFALSAPAAPKFNTDVPLAFFTNVANRFLLTLPDEYGDLSVTNISLYPTNRYTPAVHRLLQLTANLYDATTNRADQTAYPDLPTVFRPVFRTDGINVFIAGYREETNADAVNFPCVEAGELLAAVPGVLVATTNVYNAPWIIGAKKGFPNFNECEVRNAIGVSRKLEFRRANLAVDPNQVDNPVAYTNQLFALSVSNSIGTEAWNSYSNTFPRGLRLIVTNEYSLQITNTNALGFATNLYFAAGSDGVLAASTWMGYNTLLPYMPNASSFRVPVNTNLTLAQPNILRLQSASGFTNVTNERFLMAAEAGPYPLPRWRVNLTTRLRYALVDEATGRLVDYVALSQTQPELDLAWELAGRVNSTPLDDSANGAWSTNGLGGSFPEPPNGLSVGLWNQILMGIGQIAFNSLDYRKETAYGTEFFAYNLLNVGSGSPTIFRTNIFYAPFAPFRTIYQRVFWEANDPLVHYTVPDLTDLTSSETVFRTSQGTANIPANTLGGMNRRYSPWAGRPGYPSPPDAYDLSKKDPGMFRPDRWIGLAAYIAARRGRPFT
jgi:hypothetical protein